MGDWTWNDDPTSPADYFNWAEGEPNLNPDVDINVVQLQQVYNGDPDEPVGKWFVSDAASVSNYICQSPKIPKSLLTTSFGRDTAL